MGKSLPEYRWLWPSALAGDPAGPVPARRSTRDWVVDTLCFVIGFGFAAWATVDLLGSDPVLVQEWYPTPHWLVLTDGVLSMIAGVGLWWRRRFLIPLACYLVVLSLFSVASGPSLWIVLFTIAVHRRFPVLAAFLVVTFCTNALFAVVRPETGAGFHATFWWGNVMVVIVALWGMLVRSRRQLIVSWRERAERAESEQQLRIAQARVLERTRIAREMHDVLAHRISLLSLHAGALEYRPDAPAAEIAGAAAVVRESAHQALQDLRAVIGVLRDGQSEETGPPERPQPTLTALPALADESRSAGIKVRLEVTADSEAAPVATARAAYRIIQEGLTNVRKHAPGAVVRVAVGGAPGEGLTIEIRNPLPLTAPAAPIPGTGVGLIGLAERATLAGGRLSHGIDGDEFVLSSWLPWTQ
ncbi:sensor histidine kinase [Actinoplanes sp. GCM10030250]|uniref:sensor histidine kinase n=1 Tax=Actinoplanes sp. GCM10030250 TaxID=3273376 RepID=UPI00360D694C